MRIGIDARTLSHEYTGIPIFLHDMIKYWNDNMINDSFFLYSNRYFELDFKLNKNWTIVIDEKPLGTVWQQLVLPKHLHRDKIDVFWEPMHFLPQKIDNIRYVVTVHDISVLLSLKFGSFSDMIMERLLLKKSCQKADSIMAISQSTCTDLVNVLKVPKEKIQVIYNGDSPYNYSRNDQCGLNSNTLIKYKLNPYQYFLFVGTIEPRKNIGTIISAYERFRNKKEIPYKLVLAGKKGWKSGQFYKQIEKSKYKEDIVLTGYVSEIEKEELYCNAISLVFPSLYEGFGFPILEALSLGVPVITSNCSSMPEVGGNSCFYLNNAMDSDELSELMITTSELSEDEKKGLAERGKEWSRHFSRNKCAEKLYDLLTKKEEQDNEENLNCRTSV